MAESDKRKREVEDEIREKYRELCDRPSDINEHLPVLEELSSECASVAELGVRDVVSSYAFAAGLLRSQCAEKRLTQVDLVKSTAVSRFSALCTKFPKLKVEFFEENSITVTKEKTDLVFIDTWHVYGQMVRELEAWKGYANKYFVLHDTTIDGEKGETIRNGWNAGDQSRATGIPISEITKGIWPAVTEFLEKNSEWRLEKRYTNNNGLTILKRIRVKALIIYNEHMLYEQVMRKAQEIWMQMNNVEAYFLCLGQPKWKASPVPTLYFPGDESLVPGILVKTVEGAKFLMRRIWNEGSRHLNNVFVVRQNISSIVNFDKLRTTLVSVPNGMAENYASCAIRWEKGSWGRNIEFPSGTCFVMGINNAEKLANIDTSGDEPNDVAVARKLPSVKWDVLPGSVRTSMEWLGDGETSMIRNKTDNRDKDAMEMLSAVQEEHMKRVGK